MSNQAYLFIIFILNGILIGILFDIFRILRKSFKTSDIVTYIEDIVFWLLTGLITLYFIFTYNNGEIRLYIFLGIVLGTILYMLTISKYFIKINVKIINFIKTITGKIIFIFLYPLKIIFKVLQKLFFRPFSFVFINIRKTFTKCNPKNLKLWSFLANIPKKQRIKKDF